MRLILITALLVALGLAETSVVNGYKSYKDYKIYEVQGPDNVVRKFVVKLVENNDEIIEQYVNNKLQVLIPPSAVTTFIDEAEKKNIQYRLIHDDFSRMMILPGTKSSDPNRMPSNEPSFHLEYHDIDPIFEYLKNLTEKYPDQAKLISVGKSYEGRQIHGLNINNFNDFNEDKPAFFMESGIHAREWISPATALYFADQLLSSNDPDIMFLRENFDWHIFPVVNPDGYHYTRTNDRMWRKTRSKSSLLCYGADANRNWNHNWGQHGSSSNPCNYQTYAGSQPFSEVETRQIAKYLTEMENLLGYLAFHADAQMLLVPYSDSTEHTDNYDDLITIGKVSLEYGKKVNGSEFEGPATAAEILYKASGGSMDWVREALAVPLVYTYELRGYYFQWPQERIPEQGEEVTQMILGLVKEAGRLGYY